MDKDYWLAACAEVWEQSLPSLSADAITKGVDETWQLAFKTYMCDDFVLKYTDPVSYANHCVKIWIERNKNGG